MSHINIKKSLEMIVYMCLLAMFLFTGHAFSDSPATPKTSRDLTVEQNVVYSVQNAVVTPSALQITGWVDHQNNRYAVGEKVRLFVQTNKDAYITVLNVGASGKTTQLLPNKYQTNNFVKAHTPTEIPAPNVKASILVSGPAGRELIKIIASTAKIDFFTKPADTTIGPFQSITGGAMIAARDIQSALNTMQNQHMNFEWDDDNKIIHTVATKPDSASTTIASMTPATLAVSSFVSTYPSDNGNVNTTPAATFQLSTDKNSYRVGEKIRVAATSEIDCYLTLVNFQTDGQIVVLFPNKLQPSNLIQAGQTMMFPGHNTNLSVKAKGPIGIENLVAMCSTKKISVSSSFTNREAALRDLTVVTNHPGKQTTLVMVGFFVTK